VRRVYVEGLTDQDVPIFKAKIAALGKVGTELASLRNMLKQLGKGDAGRLAEELETVEGQHHRDLLRLGAVPAPREADVRVRIERLQSRPARAWAGARRTTSGGALRLLHGLS